MKIKLSLKKIICYIIIFYPIIYMPLYMINDDYSRMLGQLVLVSLFLVSFKRILIKNNKDFYKNLFGFVGILFEIILAIILWGFYYILNQDFYAMILLLLVFLVFSDDNYLVEFAKLIERNNIFWLFFILYISILFISILFFNGLRVETTWGISLPVLYGPFLIPHGLSYLQLNIYCMASVQLHKTKEKKYLAIMIFAVLCAVWTGVRTGVLAMALLICSDYFTIQRASKKATLAIIGGLVLLYLCLFTNVIANNPLIQKTADAISRNNISNGRGYITGYLMNYYVNDSNILQKLTGISLSGIRELMYSVWGTSIHAHNDFVNIIVGYGMLGILFFLHLLIRFCRKAPKWILLFLVLSVLAYWNGLYMYIAFTPSIPVVIVFYRYIYNHKKKMI